MPKRKVDLDQYYTSHEVAGECVDLFTSYYGFEEFDEIIEPSAGSGRFLDFLPSPKTVGLDIRPGDPRVHKQNFLTWTPQDSTKKFLLLATHLSDNVRLWQLSSWNILLCLPIR